MRGMACVGIAACVLPAIRDDRRPPVPVRHRGPGDGDLAVHRDDSGPAMGTAAGSRCQCSEAGCGQPPSPLTVGATCVCAGIRTILGVRDTLVVIRYQSSWDVIACQ